jgi:F-type H+-transporting ATPase subunit c
VIRFTKAALFFVLLILAAVPAIAQEATPATTEGELATAQVRPAPLFSLGAISAGVVMIAAAYGISRIGASAVESMARQPEVAATIQVAMLITAALIEGATFFALIVCWLAG